MERLVDSPKIKVVIEGTQAFRRYRGWGRYCLELLKAFADSPSNIDYEVFYHREGQNDAWFEERLARPHLRLHPLDVSLKRYTELEENFNESWIEKRFPDADVYHSITEFPFYAPHLARIATIHELTPVLLPEKHSQNFVDVFHSTLTQVFQMAHAIVAVSENTGRDLQSYRPELPRPYIECIPNGVSEIFFSRTLGPLPPQQSILFVGPVKDRIKNFTLLAEALRAMPATSLAVVTPEDVSADSLRSQFDLSHHSVRVLRHLSDESLLNEYLGARVLVFPSLHEGFGLPVAEAMAVGCPVLCGHHSSLVEVAGGYCGTFDVESAESLKSELLSELSHPDLVRRHGAWEFARGNFRWKAAAQSYEKLYTRVAENRRLTRKRLDDPIYSSGYVRTSPS